ncbi:MAG: SdpI family protein [candidate division WOR-3 bacterium]
MKHFEIIILLIPLISFIIGVFFYPYMPEKIEIHWNTNFQVDQYVSKFWGLFSLPITLLLLSFLFIIIPKVDPLRENYKKFEKYYKGFCFLILIFLFLTYLWLIAWNIGIRIISLSAFLSISLGIISFYLGILLENVKQNWFIGIRTPWTLSNEKVWDKTNKTAGKLFKFSSIIIFLGVIFPKYLIFLIVILAILISVYSIIYSYLLYQKITNL